jgi:hypothetical protein
MRFTFDHPALAFHSRHELPLQARHAVAISLARADRCYLLSSSAKSTASPQQNTLSTSGASSPTYNASGEKSTITSTEGAPVFTLTGGKGSVNYTQTDEGAIQGALTLASQAIANTADNFNSLLSQQGDEITGDTGLLTTSLQNNSDLAAQVQSGGQTETNATLIKLALVAGVVIVGIVLLVFKGKK